MLYERMICIHIGFGQLCILKVIPYMFEQLLLSCSFYIRICNELNKITLQIGASDLKCMKEKKIGGGKCVLTTFSSIHCGFLYGDHISFQIAPLCGHGFSTQRIAEQSVKKWYIVGSWSTVGGTDLFCGSQYFLAVSADMPTKAFYQKVSFCHSDPYYDNSQGKLGQCHLCGAAFDDLSFMKAWGFLINIINIFSLCLFLSATMGINYSK